MRCLTMPLVCLLILVHFKYGKSVWGFVVPHRIKDVHIFFERQGTFYFLFQYLFVLLQTARSTSIFANLIITSNFID